MAAILEIGLVSQSFVPPWNHEERVEGLIVN